MRRADPLPAFFSFDNPVVVALTLVLFAVEVRRVRLACVTCVAALHVVVRYVCQVLGISAAPWLLLLTATSRLPHCCLPATGARHELCGRGGDADSQRNDHGDRDPRRHAAVGQAAAGSPHA